MRIERFQRENAHRYECWDDYGCSILASAVVLERDEHTYLKHLDVRSSHRGRGIGTKLLGRIISDFEDKPIVADVFEARVPWYRRHGFEPVGKKGGLIEIIRSFRGNFLK